MRIKRGRWMFFSILISSYLVQFILTEELSPSDNSSKRLSNANENQKDLRGIFSPRMDYEQWKPLGRGDPLKNDPTYDYVPPVLDRVHYWIDPALRKPDPPLPSENQKTEILLLGVSSKKPSTATSSSGVAADSTRDNYDSFLKFVDGPKFNSHQRIARPHYSLPSSYYPSPFYTNKNKVQENRGTFSKGSEQRIPYTMLMPPPAPLVTKKPLTLPSPFPIQKPITPPEFTTTPTKTMSSITVTYPTPLSTSTSSTTTPSEVTIQSANLIYQSSSLSDEKEWQNKNQYVTPGTSSNNQINWTPNPYMYTTKKTKPFNDEIVFQKHLQPPQSYIQIEFSPSRQNNFNLTNNSLLVASNSDHNINYVTPPPLIEEVMHKGQVSDDNLDISNTYVKIGKTEAQMHSTGIDMSPDIPIVPSDIIIRPPMVNMHQRPNMMIYSHVNHPSMNLPPMTMQTIQSMQTMQPPQIPTSPVYKKTTTNPILNALQKEKVTTESIDYSDLTTTVQTTIAPPQTTTTSLTTDPLFKHYKQPAEPMKGPLYLIIQGHSKVKTYGPSKQIHGILVQETNEISDDKDEFNVKHLHGYNKKDNGEKPRRGRSGDLQTLKHVVQTGTGAIDFTDISPNRRKDDVDVKEADLEVGYKVGMDRTTSEKYYKGIVEEARKLKNFDNATEH